MYFNILKVLFYPMYDHKQIRFVGLFFLVAFLTQPMMSAAAQDAMDTGGLTFRDFAVQDRGASLNRRDSMLPDGPGPTEAPVTEIDNAGGLARVRFDPVKAVVAIPLGWAAFQDGERGTAYSADRSYRLLVWKLDFPFEGVRDAEHYAEAKAGTIRARHAGVQVQAHKLKDGRFLVIYENAPRSQGDQELRTVFDIIIPDPHDPKAGVLMTLGVPASQTERGAKLASLLSKNIRISW